MKWYTATGLLIEPVYRKDPQLDRFAVGCYGASIVSYEGFIINEGHRCIGTVISQMVLDVLDVLPCPPFVFGNCGCQRVSSTLMGVVEVSIMIPNEQQIACGGNLL